MSSFTCEICFEEQGERFALPKLQTGNGDVLRAGDCNHPVCVTCMAAHVRSRTEEQRVFGVRCPIVGCSNQIFEQDVQRLADKEHVSPDVRERFFELRARDYTARVDGICDDDDLGMVETMWKTTRLCPRCSLVIEKAQGCNSFYCICGHHFNYEEAPRAVGRGVKKYGRVISFAKRMSLKLSEAEKLRGDHRGVGKLAEELQVSVRDALDLSIRAKAGDEGVRAAIRKARRPRCEVEVCQVELVAEEPCFDECLMWQSEMDEPYAGAARDARHGYLADLYERILRRQRH